ncbi:hypothetical protein TWF694_005632 [Orbilia ellipsospora]|uniref:DNA endonuclease activator Ctp1 C-terminal domain-containing protein n=1 Tax=Orbilia ellipsospora TaxID=2528407 RepID=A0AAV9WTU0_9PEZI
MKTTTTTTTNGRDDTCLHHTFNLTKFLPLLQPLSPRSTHNMTSPYVPQGDLMPVSVLRSIENLTQNITKAIRSFEAEKKKTIGEYLEKCRQKDEENSTFQNTTPDSETLPPYLSVQPQTRVIDDVEYVAKIDYDKVVQERHIALQKYDNVRARRKHIEEHLQRERDRCKRQNIRFQETLATEKAKVATYDDKYKKLQKGLEVLPQAIKRISKRHDKANETYNAKFAQWKTNVLKKGTINTSDFEQFPLYESFPEVRDTLQRIYQGFSAYLPPREKSLLPHATPTSTTPINGTTSKKSPTLVEGANLSPPQNSSLENLYSTSDEEPESALQKFSPTSRAVLRQPGSETLAILHPEHFSPIGERRHALNVEEDELLNIKLEPSSEADWYSKYGYSRIEQSSIDLDNIRGNKRMRDHEQRTGSVTPTQEHQIRDIIPVQLDLQTNISKPQMLPSKPDSPITIDDSSSDTSDKIKQHGVRSSNKLEISTANEIRQSPSSSPPLHREADRNKKDPGRWAALAALPGPTPIPEDRCPLGEIPQPNHTLEPLQNPTVSNIRRRNGRVHHGQENPATDKKLFSLLSTSTQNERFPPVGQHPQPSTVIEKGNKVNDATLARQKNGKTKQTNILFAPESPKYAAQKDEVSPREKRPADELQSTPKPKKRRIETVPETAAKDVISQNPFSPGRYKINPQKNDGFDFAFTEVVRDKAKKACLSSCVKPCCRDFASGKLHEMWQPPEVFKGPRFSAADSSQPDPEEEGLLKTHDQYREWIDTVKKTEQALQYGRHRVQHEKAAEVKFFWESDFPTTQQLEEQREESEKRYREKGFSRHDQARKGGIFELR